MKHRRLISIMLAVLLMFSLCAPALAAEADTLTRGEFVTALFDLSGVTDMEPRQAYFEDVPMHGDLALAVRWAVGKGIVSGYGDGRFGPDDSVTREQMAAMLYRYAQALGQGFRGMWYFPLDYPDASEISDWADEAMHWCVMHGILTGTDRGLEPKAPATDDQLTLVLERWRKAAQAGVSDAVGSLSRDGYVLEQVVVLSRHNIRSPLSGGGSLLGTITPMNGSTGRQTPASFRCAAACWRPRWGSISASGWRPRASSRRTTTRPTTRCAFTPTPSSAPSPRRNTSSPACCPRRARPSRPMWPMTPWTRSSRRS